MLTIFTVACTENTLVENPPIENNGDTITDISITGKDFQVDGDTRSSVSVSENGASFLWDEDDVIGIFPDKGDQVSFAMEQGAGTQTATFTGGGWALKSSATYAAYYPHVYENRDLTKIPVSYVGQTQNGNANTDHIGAYDFMAASVTTPSNGAVAFDMQHLGALVQLTITVPQPSTLKKIVLSSSSNFTQTGTIDLTAEAPAIVAEIASNSIEIALNNITTSEANESVIVYFMTAPIDLSESELTATIHLSDGTIRKVEITGKNFEAGKAYRLAVIIDDKNSSDNETEGYITFEDSVAKIVCLNKYDSNGDGQLSISEVSTIESIDRFFFGEYTEAVTSFNELKFFTSLQALDYCQFDGCVNLKNITLPNNIETIGYQSFYNCKKLEKIVIPNSVNWIGQSAFGYCQSLTDVIIPDNVTAIYADAFSHCSKLSYVKIGNGVKVISSTTFGWCNELSKVEFGLNIESIERNAFTMAGSGKIKDVVVADLGKWIKVKFENTYSSPTIFGANLWEGDKLVTKCIIPNDVVNVGVALKGCSSIEEIIISDGMLTIKDEAFWSCSNLKKVKIGNDVVAVGNNVFWNCSQLSSFEGKFASADGRCLVVDNELRYHASAGLTEYTIPKGINSISYQAFSATTGPDKVIIGNDVEAITEMAFYGSGVKEIVIKDNVKTIGGDAFGWTNLETVYCESQIPPTAEFNSTSWDAFYNTKLKDIYVPSDSVDAYKTASGWKDYADYIRAYDFAK